MDNQAESLAPTAEEIAAEEARIKKLLEDGGALIALDAPKTPEEREAAAKRKAEEAQGMSNSDIDIFTALATAPKKGEKYPLGNKVFTMSFVNIDVEQEMMNLMVDTLKATGAMDMAQALLSMLPALTEVAATILASRHYLNCSYPEAIQWIREQDGDYRVSTGDLLKFVMAQAGLQEMGQSLGKLLTPAGLAGALTRLGNIRSQSLAPILLNGPQTDTDRP